MTVQEMVKQLKKMPGDSFVIIQDPHYIKTVKNIKQGQGDFEGLVFLNYTDSIV